MPDPAKSTGNRSRPDLSDEEISARLSKLTDRFGDREVSFYLTTPGDYAIGTVEDVSEFTHEEFGASPQVTLKLDEGESAETGEIKPGNSYVIRLFPKAVKGRALKPGYRIEVANYGTARNQTGTFDYQDIVLRILPPA